MHLSLHVARALHLAAQGLHERPRHPPSKDDVLKAIQRMGALQIDTISVVARSHYFVLWSRLGQYDPWWLNELLSAGSIFEYWSHAACFLPIEDFPLYRRRMLEGFPHARAWVDSHPTEIARVRAHVAERGEVRSADFQRTDGRVQAWWDWKPEKRALECLYALGELMIARRDRNFHRIYAPRERVLPGWDDAPTPSAQSIRRELVLKSVRALGITTARWVPDYFRLPKAGITALMQTLVADGCLVEAQIETFSEPAYIHPDSLPLARAAASGDLSAAATTLLSPFDPVVWDRDRARSLFGFDYRIETYTPAARRRYGYFTLPILHRGALLGRLDAKAHRKAGRFEVKAVHLEPGVPVTPELATALAATLHDCAGWHGTPALDVLWSDPPEMAAELSRAL